RTIDGFSKVLHNRFNQDIPGVAAVREGEAVQFLCRDALDIGTAATTLTPSGVLTLDLGKVHPLTGPVEVEGAEPGDLLEVEIVDVAPLVDFGYVTIGPALGLFGGLRPDLLAPFHQFTKGSRLYYPVYVKGAKFSVGDGHMAQGDGEVCVTAIETLMAVTCRFKVIKNTIIESPQAIVPAANPTDFGLTREMLAKGFYH